MVGGLARPCSSPVSQAPRPAREPGKESGAGAEGSGKPGPLGPTNGGEGRLRDPAQGPTQRPRTQGHPAHFSVPPQPSRPVPPPGPGQQKGRTENVVEISKEGEEMPAPVSFPVSQLLTTGSSQGQLPPPPNSGQALLSLPGKVSPSCFLLRPPPLKAKETIIRMVTLAQEPHSSAPVPQFPHP